ncbi:hypothetical protein GP486_006455, partial [Trichoglossum hirsutum]
KDFASCITLAGGVVLHPSTLELALGRVRLQVLLGRVPALLRLPRVLLGSLELGGISRGPHELVFGHVSGGLIGRGAAVDHRSGLGIVLGRVEVQVEEVFGRVLADTQVPGGGALLASHVGFFGVSRLLDVAVLVIVVVVVVVVSAVVVGDVISAVVVVVVAVSVVIVVVVIVIIVSVVVADVGVVVVDVVDVVFGLHLLVLPLSRIVLSCLLPQLLQTLIFINDVFVLGRVIAIPSVPLCVPSQADVLHGLVSLNVLSGPLCTQLSGPAEALSGLVRHGTAVLARPLAVLGGSGTEPPAAVVPYRVVRGGSLETLVLEIVDGGRVVIDVEGLFGDEGRNVLVAFLGGGRHVCWSAWGHV